MQCLIGEFRAGTPKWALAETYAQLAAPLRSLTGRWMRFTRCSAPTSLRFRADQVGNQPIYVIFEDHHSCLQIETIGCDQPEATNTRIHN